MMKSKNPESYEQAFAEIQELLLQLENPATPLDELSRCSARIRQLLDFCKQRLRQLEAEQ